MDWNKVWDQGFPKICMEWMACFNKGEESALIIKDNAATSGMCQKRLWLPSVWHKQGTKHSCWTVVLSAEGYHHWVWTK